MICNACKSEVEENPFCPKCGSQQTQTQTVAVSPLSLDSQWESLLKMFKVLILFFVYSYSTIIGLGVLLIVGALLWGWLQTLF